MARYKELIKDPQSSSGKKGIEILRNLIAEYDGTSGRQVEAELTQTNKEEGREIVEPEILKPRISPFSVESQQITEISSPSVESDAKINPSEPEYKQSPVGLSILRKRQAALKRAA